MQSKARAVRAASDVCGSCVTQMYVERMEQWVCSISMQALKPYKMGQYVCSMSMNPQPCTGRSSEQCGTVGWA